MQKSVVQVWLNDVCSKQINVTPSSTCEDIIKSVADQYNIPKRATRHLELHVVHNGKDHSTVQREEKILSHLQSLAEAGLRIDENSHKNKYVLQVNHDAVKKAHKLAGHGKSSWSPLSYFKKRSGGGLQRSASAGLAEDPGKSKAEDSKLSNSTNALQKTRPPESKAKPSDSILEAEKMPSASPNVGAPHLTPRSSISPPRAGMRARSKTLSPSLSSSDLRNQEALNQMITQRIRNRSSLSYERPPLLDSHSIVDPNDGQNSPRIGIGNSGGMGRSVSPPPPQRLFEPPIHLSPSTSSSHISVSSHSLPASAPRQRSMTTSGPFNRFTPPRSQFADVTLGPHGAPATTAPSLGDYHPPLSSSSSSSVSSSTSSSSHHKEGEEHLELLAIVDLLKKAT
jgi:hypothetical protein